MNSNRSHLFSVGSWLVALSLFLFGLRGDACHSQLNCAGFIGGALTGAGFDPMRFDITGRVIPRIVPKGRVRKHRTRFRLPMA